MNLADLKWKRCVLLACVVCVCALYAPQPATAAAKLDGRYTVRENTISYKLQIPNPPPAAVIVIQHLPPGTEIKSSSIEIASYDKKSGEAKWLLKDVRAGLLTMELVLAGPVDKEKLRSEVMFKDATSWSETAFVPEPAMKKKLEGC